MKFRSLILALILVALLPASASAYVSAWCGHGSNVFGNELVVFAGHGAWAPPMVTHHRAHYQWVIYGNGAGGYVLIGTDTVLCWT